MLRGLGEGVRTLGRGFLWWRRSPGRMSAGLIPAGIVSVLALAGLIVLGSFLPAIATAVTPFAEDWPAPWPVLLRIVVGAGVLGAALVLIATLFTAVCLAVGEPFYDRIWREVELGTRGTLPDARYGFGRAVADGLSLAGRGIVVAAAVALIGLVPLVGAVLGFLIGLVWTGWLLADELSSRALTARGLPRGSRRALLRAHRGRALGFGIATQLCFLVPLGAIAVMPAAVAGSTLLAQDLLAEQERRRGA